MKRKYYIYRAFTEDSLVYTENEEDIKALPAHAKQITRKEALKLCREWDRPGGYINYPAIVPAADNKEYPVYNPRLAIKNTWYLYERIETEKLYNVRPEYIHLWTSSSGTDVLTVPESKLKRLSHERNKPIEELQGQLEEI